MPNTNNNKNISPSNVELTKELFKKMLLIRRFEEKIADIYFTDVIKSPVHLSIGQEAVAVGVCNALKPEDYISNTYRCHATHIAKGGDLNAMMAELYGKATGCAGGKAGSMHLVEISKGIIGASAVVGTTIPVAAGFALAMQKDDKNAKNKRVVVTMFGDGATEEGCFSETVNFAALKKLPMLFICENNQLAIHNPVHRRWATPHICERMETYGIKTIKIDSGDVFEITQKTQEAIDAIRAGQGPIFMEVATYRYREHVGPGEDLNEEYRDLNVYQSWKKNDQIDALAQIIGSDEANKIENEVKALIDASIKFSEESKFPEPKELYNYVYA
jgi:TPP-dependent pyruvate/acetoin dehydrogenase alpha subunit